MADRELRIRLTIDDQGAVSKLEQIDRAVDGVANSTQDLANKQEQLGRKSSEATGKNEQLKSAMEGLHRQIMNVVGPAAMGLLLKQAIDYAGAIADMSAQTGLSTQALQRFEGASTVAGGSLSQVTSAISMMADKIGSGDKSARAAFQALGMDFEAVKRQKPEENFYAVAKGIAAIEDPYKRAQVASDIFGRAGRELIPTLLAIAEGTGEIATNSGSAIEGMDKVGDQFDLLVLSGKRLIVEVFGPLAGALAAVAGPIKEIGSWIFAAGPNLGGTMADWVRGTEWGQTLGWLTGNLPDTGPPAVQGTGAALALRNSLVPTLPSLDVPDAATMVEFQNWEKGRADAFKAANDAAKREEAFWKSHTLTFAEGLPSGFFPEGEARTPFGLFRGAGALGPGTEMLFLPGGPGWLPGQQTGPPGQSVSTLINTGRFGPSIWDVLFPTTQPGAGALGPGLQPPSALSRFWGGMGSPLVAGLPGVVGSAIQGGGNIGGSIGNLVGAGAGAGLAALAGPGLGLGASLALGVGTMGIGLAVGLLVMKMMEPSELEKARKLREELIETAGGFEKIKEMAEYAGLSVDQFMRARTQSGVRSELQAIQTAYDEVRRRVQLVIDDLKDVSERGILLGPELMERLFRDMNKPEVKEALGEFIKTETQRAIDGITAIVEAPFLGEGALGGVANAIADIFSSLMKQGVPVGEALRQLWPAIEGLTARLGETGTTGITAFEDIKRWAGIANGELTGPVLDAVSGANSALTGLHNIGMLTGDTFRGLGDVIVDAFGALTGQGVDAKDALILMQPTLQTVWELMRDFGYEATGALQSLVDMAEEAGLVGDRFRPSADRMITAIEALIAKIDEFIVRLTESLRDGVEQGLRGIDGAINGWRPPLVRIPVEYVSGDGGTFWRPPGAAMGGLVTGEGVAYFGRGGWVPRGTDTVPAMLTPGEFILNRDAVRRIGVETLSALNRGQGVNVTVNMDARGRDYSSTSERQRLADTVAETIMLRLRANTRISALA